MTGEVTDRSNETTLFGMALFWQKAIEFFTKFIIHFLTYRAECLFSPEFYTAYFACSTDLFQIGRNMNCWVTGRCTAAKLIGGRELLMVV